MNSSGEAFVAGGTLSNNYPVTPGAFQTIYGGGEAQAFITALNAAGSAAIYSTYLGGSGGSSIGAIVLDGAGNAYVTGGAGSGFPTTSGAFQTTGDGVFVSKINTTGSALVYSTYMGDGVGLGIAVDSFGSAYIVGQSDSFPVTQGAFQSTCVLTGTCGFVAKLNSTGSALDYATYLASDYFAEATGIVVDGAGNAYVVGETGSGFPITPGAFEVECPNNCTNAAAFAAKLNAEGSALAYATYLGGTKGAFPTSVAEDAAGNIYLAGYTCSENYPVTAGAFQTKYIASSCSGDADGDGFLTKMYLPTSTTASIAASPNPSAYEQSVTFTATVSSALGTPPDGGTVNFLNGKKILGTGTLSDGSATASISTLAPGTTSIDAEYLGDSNFLASTSTAVSQVITAATSTTTLASSVNPSNSGQKVTFTATVVGQFGGKVTGTVTFKDGTTTLGTVNVGEGKATYKTSALATGTHDITATYGGSSDFAGSSASLTQTVN